MNHGNLWQIVSKIIIIKTQEKKVFIYKVKFNKEKFEGGYLKVIYK